MKLSLTRALAGEIDPELNRAMWLQQGWKRVPEFDFVIQHPMWKSGEICEQWKREGVLCDEDQMVDFLNSISSLGHCAAAEAGLTDVEHAHFRTHLWTQTHTNTGMRDH